MKVITGAKIRKNLKMLKFFKISCHFSAIYVKNHFNDVNKGVDSIGD
jgi:hypothetical protein